MIIKSGVVFVSVITHNSSPHYHKTHGFPHHKTLTPRNSGTLPCMSQEISNLSSFLFVMFICGMVTGRTVVEAYSICLSSTVHFGNQYYWLTDLTCQFFTRQEDWDNLKRWLLNVKLHWTGKNNFSSVYREFLYLPQEGVSSNKITGLPILRYIPLG